MKLLCDTMRRQIMSRAFYGWLAHSRHIAVVRTHLSALVNLNSPSTHDSKYDAGVNDATWAELVPENGKVLLTRLIVNMNGCMGPCLRQGF